MLADPAAYADDERLHAGLTWLRVNEPVAWVDSPPYRPFWAITKHADIMAIERDNELFVSGPRPVLARAEREDLLKAQQEAGHRLAHPDPHGRPATPRRTQDRRRLVRPKAMRDLKVGWTNWPSVTSTPCVTSVRMRLRHRHRRRLSAVCDPVPARTARGRLPADAQAHPGVVRRRRRRTPARRRREDLLAVLADFFIYFTT